MHKFKNFLQPNKKQLRKFVSIVTTITLVGSFVIPALPTPADAAATKSVLGTAPFSPSQNVQIEIRVSKPSSVNVSPVEIVFVVDASGSLASHIQTAKARMTEFANWLTSYYGHAKVGIVSFGFPEDNTPGLITHMPLTAINSAANVTSMKNAINAIQARGDGLGFSDIQKGIIRGNSLFSSAAASGRHLVLLTDGLANYAASGSVGLGYPWDGVCPLHPSPARTSVSGLRYTQFIIIPQGLTGNQVPSATDWSGSTGLSTYVPPCQSYINTHHGGYLTGMGLIDAMIAHYPGSKSKQASMASTIDFLENVITPYTMNVVDAINPSVFSAITSAGSVRNCSNNAAVSSSNTVTGGGRTINASAIRFNTSITQYCLRFNATINSSISTGTYAVNTSSSANIVRYYNVYGTQIATDSIAVGSISIAGDPDLSVTQFWLTNSSGTVKHVFERNEAIYSHTRIANLGDSNSPSNFRTAFYKHASASVATNTASNIPMYIINPGVITPGTSKAFDSYVGATFPSSTSPTAQTGNPRYWTQTVSNNYNAVAFANYNNGVTESTYPANNRLSRGYSVITLPSNLATQNLLCHRSNFTWTAGSANITGYKVKVTDVVAYTQSVVNGTPYNDYVTYTPTIGSNPSSTSATGLKGNTLYSLSLTPTTIYGDGRAVSMSFRTPVCPDFDASVGGPYALYPGQASDTIVNVNIDYLPNVASWTSHSAQLTARVVGINHNNESCAAYSANGAAFTGNRNGLTARVSGNPSVSQRTFNAPTNPVTFTIRSTASTTTGRYTICFGVFSPNSFITKTELLPVHINVELRPWYMIDRPSTFTTSLVGDVHSNASMTNYVPLNQYFFKSGTAGVVTSSSAIVGMQNNVFSSITSKIWKLNNYTPVRTESYENLEALAIASLPNPADGIPTSGPSFNASWNAQCSRASGVYKYVPATGTLTRSSEINLANQGCAGKNHVYFIEGSLNVTANIIDDTNDATLTFIIRDNLTVAANVTRLDGVYIFGGRFQDGTVYNTTTGTKDEPLVVNGSLIGLATQTPSTSKGTFSLGVTSGLQRNLSYGADGNDFLAAERIVYQPKYLFLLRNLLGTSNYTWSE